MSTQKTFRQKPLDFEEFQELWEGNQKFEVAQGLLLTLKASRHISLDDKLTFLCEISCGGWIASARYWWNPIGGAIGGVLGEMLDNLCRQAFGYCLELQPLWNGSSKACSTMLDLLRQDRLYKGFEPAIKKFMQSLLNAEHTELEKGSNIWRVSVPGVLLKLRMFEELVNYGFTESNVIKELLNMCNIVLMQKGQELTISMPELVDALAKNREPHALSTALRLLAKQDPHKLFPHQLVFQTT